MSEQRIAGIQLDLKYVMPNKEYLLDWAKRLPGYGIDTLLIEYEDKFPYESYPFLRSGEAFTPDELQAFLETCRRAGLRVMPLVQSLSHLEFALAHEELAYLREAPDIPTQLCPSKPESVAFLKDLMGDVLAWHEPDEFFHIGGDETWFLGACPKCREWIDRVGPIRMWVEHQNKVLEFIRSAGKRPIVWDDIFWKDFEAIRSVGLPRDTVLHAWNYNITSLGGPNEDASDLEFGGAGGVLRQIEIYADAGYESIAAPCYNYGNLIPRITPSLKNTRVWAQKVKQAHMLGMINTSWACFHVPLPAQNMLVAATGALCADPALQIDVDWQAAFLEKEFSADPACATLDAPSHQWFTAI